MADQQHLLEQLLDLLNMAANKLRQCGEVRHRIAAPLHLAAGGDALAVGEQDDLQQDGGIVD